MNIDLIKSRDGQIGIVCSASLPALPQMVLFDPDQGIVSLEYPSDHESLVCNIPVVNDWRLDLSMQDSILIGCIDKDTLLMAERIPLRSFH